ncbi:MAG: radical SAM protein [Phycisphaeraceae bacterium]
MSTLTVYLDSHLARMVHHTQRLAQKRWRLPALQPVVCAVDYLARAAFHVWRNRQYLTIMKLANMALVNVQFRMKTERVVGRPYRMKIESTNICNTKCQLCPTGLGYAGRAKGKMSLEQYRQLIEQLKGTLYSLDLSMWGDPLIVPEIFDMIRYAHDRRIWTYISSNLHALKLDPEKRQAERLVESGLDVLTCSLHGASQETFAIYQPGKSLADAVAKVRHIVETRNRMGSATPKVQLNFVVTRYNEHEVEAFQQLADDLGCKAVISWAALNVRFLNRDQHTGQPLNLAPDVLAKKARTHIERWLPESQQHKLAVYDAIQKGEYQPGDFNGRKLYDCSWPWLASVINWDGTVVTCCGSWDQEEDMGSVLDQRFGRVWNGKKYRMARRSFKKRVNEAEAKDNPCATCPGYMI